MDYLAKNISWTIVTVHILYGYGRDYIAPILPSVQSNRKYINPNKVTKHSRWVVHNVKKKKITIQNAPLF